MRRRRVALGGLALGIALVALAHPYAAGGSDLYGNVGPESQLLGGGLAERHPLSHYALDQHFKGIEASLTGGVDVSGVPPLIAYFLANLVWQLTAFLANGLITLFTFAFSLDLVSGSDATGGAGALEPVSRAVRTIYTHVFGGPWLAVAITVAGLWAMWKALVQRRYAETAGALGMSLLYCVLALAIVTHPDRTIGEASRFTNQLSGAFLSLSSHGDLRSEQEAKRLASDQLFSLLVYDPWVVLNFGGVEHCTVPGTGSDDHDPESVPVRPLARDPARDRELRRRLTAGREVTGDGKACRNNRAKYAPHFLRYPPGSGDRDAEYDALNSGDAARLPDSDPSKERGDYRLGIADKPATDAMEKGGQYQRLLIALVILAGELGAFLLLGSLSIAVILAQVVLLLLVAFSPVALVAGVYPGGGHDFFRGWLTRLAAFLLRKAIYSLILAVLLAVTSALADASANLGWFMSFGLQALFLWAVFIYRKELTGQLTAATAGVTPAREDAGRRLQSLYYSTQLARRPARSLRAGPAWLAVGAAGLGAGLLARARPRRAARTPHAPGGGAAAASRSKDPTAPPPAAGDRASQPRASRRHDGASEQAKARDARAADRKPGEGATGASPARPSEHPAASATSLPTDQPAARPDASHRTRGDAAEPPREQLIADEIERDRRRLQAARERQRRKRTPGERP
jgi:hypothetical protein